MKKLGFGLPLPFAQSWKGNGNSGKEKCAVHFLSREEVVSLQLKNQARNLTGKRGKGKFIAETKGEEMETGESRFEQMGS